MVKLALMPYCDDCPHFEEVVEKTTTARKYVLKENRFAYKNIKNKFTYCKNEKICKRIRWYLEEKMKRKNIGYEAAGMNEGLHSEIKWRNAKKDPPPLGVTVLFFANGNFEMGHRCYMRIVKEPNRFRIPEPTEMCKEAVTEPCWKVTIDCLDFTFERIYAEKDVEWWAPLFVPNKAGDENEQQ